MLPETLQHDLSKHGIDTFDEIALRQALEQRVETYTLIRLAPWPARRWKCQYRLMLGDALYDAQSVAEAYGMALLAVLQHTS